MGKTVLYRQNQNIIKVENENDELRKELTQHNYEIFCNLREQISAHSTKDNID